MDHFSGGTPPRVYRNTLVFLAAERRQLDNLKAAQRVALAWAEIVRETKRLNLTQSDSALAEAKLKEASETLKTRMKEAWCYLIYPVQESAQSEVEWMSAKVPAQDGLLARASKKLVREQGIWPELGPDNLNRQLEKYIWNGKSHLHLKDLWEYLNRYTYLPRVKNRSVLSKAVHSSVSSMLPGPFAYAERWDETKATYVGLAISGASNPQIVIDSESVIINRNTLARLEATLKPYESAKWTVATYLPYLWQPERHMFLKPEVSKDYAARVGHPFASVYEPGLKNLKCMRASSILSKERASCSATCSLVIGSTFRASFGSSARMMRTATTSTNRTGLQDSDYG